MKRDILEGNWKQYKGRIKERWGLLTDDDMEFIGGNFDRLVGRIQEKYGKKKEEIQQEISNWQI